MLRPSLPGERTVALPLEDEGGLFGGWGGSYALIDVGGAAAADPLRSRIDPRTLATAGAGGAASPTRMRARISGEAAIAADRLRDQPARSARCGSAGRWRSGRSPSPSSACAPPTSATPPSIREEGGDPDEIVVTGDRRRNSGRDRHRPGRRPARPLLLDRLRQERAREVRLTCA